MAQVEPGGSAGEDLLEHCYSYLWLRDTFWTTGKRIAAEYDLFMT
jgi:hypothetical protein